MKRWWPVLILVALLTMGTYTPPTEVNSYGWWVEGSAWTGLAGHDMMWGDSTAHRLKMNNNNGGAVTVGAVIAASTSALGTSNISAGACATTVTTSASGVASTDAIEWSHNAAVTAGTNGSLIISAYPTANNVNFQECNPTAGTITPPADTLNWVVIR